MDLTQLITQVVFPIVGCIALAGYIRDRDNKNDVKEEQNRLDAKEREDKLITALTETQSALKSAQEVSSVMLSAIKAVTDDLSNKITGVSKDVADMKDDINRLIAQGKAA